ncbi:MAG: hypothetical protein QOI68_4116, partial [Pseudonocardiales bacterium]|nr:hypothetical protein [Pseudonocardiales bacterium]
MSQSSIDEDARARNLVAAERKAAVLFDEVERLGLIKPGLAETVVSDQVRDLAADLFGTRR